MADWQEADDEQWPVRFPVEAPPRDAGERFAGRTPPRWTGTGQVDTGEVQKRLVWLLLAAEIGMLVAAACVLPLAFLNLPVEEEGVVGALLTQVGEWLGLSSQATCLVLALPVPILLVALGLNLWLYRWLRRNRRD